MVIGRPGTKRAARKRRDVRVDARREWHTAVATEIDQGAGATSRLSRWVEVTSVER